MKSRFSYAELTVLIRYPRGDIGWVGGHESGLQKEAEAINSEDISEASI